MTTSTRSGSGDGLSRRAFMRAAGAATGAAAAGLALPNGALAAARTDPVSQTTRYAPPGYEVVFVDHFHFFDDTKWVKYYDPDRYSRGEDVYWGFYPENVSIENEKAVITMSDRGDGTYASGCLRSEGLFEAHYGYFEVRMKITPPDGGCHSAFWLLSQGVYDVGNDGRDGAEVDIAVTGFNGPQYKSNFHWDGYVEPDKQTTGPHFNDAIGIHNGYHVFGLHWEPDRCRFYYDGVLKWTYRGVGIPRVSEFLILSSGPDSRGLNIRDADLPTKTYIDWIRVWQAPGS